MNRLRTVVRRAAAIAVGVGLATAGVVIPSAPAQAAPGDLTCTALVLTVTFRTPMTVQHPEATADGKATLLGCVSLTGQPMNSAEITGTGHAKATFGLTPSAAIKGDATFDWNTGPDSHFKFDVDSSTVPPTFEAKIDEGPMTGDTSIPTGPAIFVPNADFALCGCLKDFTVAALLINFA